MTIIWCMIPELLITTDRIFCHFGSVFVLFTTLTNWKIKILKKWKKTPGDIIILHICPINNKYMVHCFWDMEHYGQNFLSFWNNFCLFTPLTIPKIRIFKKWKKKNIWRYYHLKQVYNKWQSYHVLFLRYEVLGTEFFVILEKFLSFYPANNPKNQNFEKIKKRPGDIIILHKCTIDVNHIMHIWFLRYGVSGTESFVILDHFLPF